MKVLTRSRMDNDPTAEFSRKDWISVTVNGQRFKQSFITSGLNIDTPQFERIRAESLGLALIRLGNAIVHQAKYGKKQTIITESGEKIEFF